MDHIYPQWHPLRPTTKIVLACYPCNQDRSNVQGVFAQIFLGIKRNHKITYEDFLRGKRIAMENIAKIERGKKNATTSCPIGK